MSQFELDVWVTREFPRTFTHVIKGSFADPQLDTHAATDLFCYDRNAGIGAFFATVKNGRLDDGTLVVDGPQKVGPNHTLGRRWTHIVYIPVTSRFPRGTLLLFYDAASGVGEFHGIDGRGDLFLKKQYTGWRTSWTNIIAGRFGNAKLLFYDAASGTGEFYSLDESAGMLLKKSFTGWRSSWHSIITGNFSNSRNDDLLFYDKGAGVGEFYTVSDRAVPVLLKQHDNWRRSWQHIVSGQFLQSAAFDGLLFYEENSSHTEFYSTDGHGLLSRIDINPRNQWRLPWQAILTGEFTPNIGLQGTSRLCAYTPRDGAIRYFFLKPGTINTVVDLNGSWVAGGSQRAVISVASTFITVDMSAFRRPAAQGTILDPSTITVTFPDDKTYTGVLQPPKTLRWSNGSTWTKV